MLTLVLYCDGGAQPNPGDSGAGAVLIDEATGVVVAEISEALGIATNNEAEYRALLLGLERALELGVRFVHVRADSQLVVRQLKGEYSVKEPRLKPLHAEAMSLLARFDEYSCTHIPRSENAHADKLANDAIERSRQARERA